MAVGSILSTTACLPPPLHPPCSPSTLSQLVFKTLLMPMEWPATVKSIQVRQHTWAHFMIIFIRDKATDYYIVWSFILWNILVTFTQSPMWCLKIASFFQPTAPKIEMRYYTIINHKEKTQILTLKKLEWRNVVTLWLKKWKQFALNFITD